MTITLNITPDLETRLRQAAAQAGVAPDTYIANILEQYLHPQQAHREVTGLSKAEARLLQQINLGLSQETWQLYHELIAKRQAETLTPAEQKALIEITDEIESANVRRISALVELAQHRQTPV